MLYLLDKDVRTVRWNGEPLHEATSAIVKETMNGDFTLTVKYPISDSGIYQLIQEDMLIKAPTPVLGAQLFRIKKPVENNDHLEITAYHISDDVMQRSITPVSVTSQSCSMALSRMVQNTKTALGDFSFNSDIQDRRTFNTTETETLYSVLLDGKHSIVGTWEGELVRDNFAMTVKKSRGDNRGVVITTHKNLKDYQRTRNSQNVVTRIHAKSTFKPEGAEKETTIRVTVDSPLINSYPYINEKEYENNNAKTVEELQKWAQSKFSNEGIDKVSDAIKIEAYELAGQVVHMGDTVNLKSWKHNVDAFKKAIAYEFDALKEEYISLTFDDKAGTGGSRASGGLSSAADAILGVTESAQEVALEKALQNADLDFDHKAGLLRQEISDGIELARAEEVKKELSDNIDQRFNSFNNGLLQEAKRRAEEALRNAGASTLLAQEAKRIGLDSVAKLEEFKRQATSAQTALSGDLDVLKRTIANDIRPKQEQVTAEIEKQVKALIQTKNELAGVKSAQATYEETTTRRLSELTNLANGKASKSELTQTAEELASKIASVQIGGRNYIRGTRRMALASGLWASGTFRPSGAGTAKTIDVSNSPATGFDKAIRLTSSNARDQIGIAQDGFFISQGTYTMTCWVKGKRGQKVKLQTYWQVNDNSGISPIFTLSDENWTRLSFTTTRDIAGTVSIGYVYLVNADAGEYLDVLAPQLENGSLATSPKEAPEDTDGQISAVESTFKQRADSLEAGVNRLTEGLRTKADISSLNVTAENIRQSVKSLETSTQNKLDKKLSMAEFEVRASGIRQEIVNATEDKADKTLVVAEAGKLREEFSKMKVGSRNYAEDYDFSRGLWHYSQGDNSPQDWTISNGEYNVKGTTNTWKQMQIHSKEGSRSSWKSSTALLDLEVGETYTLSFQGICYSGSSSVWLSLRANRTVSGNPEIIPGTFNLTSSWQTYQVTIPALTKPDNFDFWRIILGYDGIGHVAFRKVELTRSSTRIDAGPAPEDGKTDLVVAKSEFEKTAEGLSSKLATVETYVSQDGQRQEALRKYSRDESARQATTVRELVSRDFVGKASYQEDVRGINQRIEEAKKNASNELTTRLANYRQTVDGKFTDISSQVTTYKQVTDEKFGDLSNQIVNNKNSTDGQIENVRNQLAKKVEVTDFQRVQETSKLYERILGSTDNVIANNVARMAMTSQLFQVEVAKSLGSDNNLIVRSKSMDRHTLVNEGDTKRVFVNNGIFTIRCTTNSGYTFTGFTLPLYIDRMARGETYTLNFKYRIMGRLDHNFTVVAKNHQSNEGIFSSNIAISSTAVSTEWKEFTETYNITKDFEFGISNLYPLYFYLAKNGWIEIKEIMLVRASQTNGYKASQFDDMSEAVLSVQSQLSGSWAVQNINSAGSIVSQINATNNQILIEAEKIRLKGKTLLDELTAIQGYFKRLFVGDASVGTLNSDIIRSNSITADKLVMDIAMARRFVSSDIFTDTLAAKEAFINKLRSVVVTATLLEGYRGQIGGFQIGTHEKDSSVYWITGQNQFSVGMSNGSGHWSQTALWVNWGNDWGYPGDYAWYVKNNGKMYCYNTAEFWNTPVIHGNLRVTGHIYYNNENSGKTGHWIHSSKYSNFEPSDNYLYLYYSGSGYDWIPMNKEISDRRYKSNIEASTVSGLDVVESLKTYSYRKEYDGKIEDISCGIMAQDVQKYAPEAFFENPDGAYSYNTFALVPYLVKAIQELNQKIEKLEKKA
ncbi:phage tail spike protein [Streptococcus infantis]|uniref:phage tail spike protein n=1 Tax=Streptococcus infantis TaxID=68892 RepID=UPI0039C12415